MTIEYEHHDPEMIEQWKEQDRLEWQAYTNDIYNFKVRLNHWSFKGDMEMVRVLTEVIEMYQEYADEIKRKYKQDYGGNQSKPSVDFFNRN